MRNLWLVAQREFVFRGKSSAYLISTVSMVLALMASSLLPAFMENKTKTEPLTVLVLDKTGQVLQPLQEAMAALPQGPGSRTITLGPASGSEEALMEQASRENKSLLIVEGQFPASVRARYLSANAGALTGAGAVLTPLEGLVRQARIQEQGLDPKVAEYVLNPMQSEVAQMTADGGKRDESQWLGSFLLAMGIVMALYMVILINGQFVFMGVLEEKVSRVMEVMASNVSAVAMLAGKVVGLGALGLIQFVAMLIAWAVGGVLSRGMAGEMAPTSVSPIHALLSLAFMVLGYLLYATLFAAAGALISRMEDQQTVLTPLMLLIAAPMMMVTALINNPNSTFAVVMSLIPFFSPSMMVFRVLMGDVPALQVWFSLSATVVTAVLTTWVGGRVYRAAMLSYGSRPSLRQIWGYLAQG